MNTKGIGTFIIIYLNILTSSIITGHYFLFEDASFECANMETQQCQIMVCSLPPQQWSNYLSTTPPSLIFTLDKIYKCQAAKQAANSQSMFFIGSMFGFIVLSALSDLIGRLFTIRICWVGGMISLLLLMFSSNMTDVSLALFIMGLCIIPVSLVYYSFVLQYEPNPTIRAYSNVMIDIFYSVGEVIICSLFILHPSWQMVCLGWNLMALLSLPMLFILKNLRPVIKQAEEKNKLEQLIECITNRQILINLVKLAILYCLYQFCIYTVIYNIMQTGNSYLEQTYSSAIQIPAYLLARIVLKWFQPISCLKWIATVQLLAIVLMFFFQYYAFILLVKGTLCVSWAFALVHTLNILPDEFSSLCLGILGFSSSLGTAILPILINKIGASELMLYGGIILIGYKLIFV